MVSFIAFAKGEQPVPLGYTLSRKCPYSVQQNKRSGSDEKPEYWLLRMCGRNDDREHNGQQEAGNSQVSPGLT